MKINLKVYICSSNILINLLHGGGDGDESMNWAVFSVIKLAV